MPNQHSSFEVRFANGQGNTYCDPPPPAIFPAEIWESVVDMDKSEEYRRTNPMEFHFVERFPPD